jgi:hypothetical protein
VASPCTVASPEVRAEPDPLETVAVITGGGSGVTAAEGGLGTLHPEELLGRECVCVWCVLDGGRGGGGG